MLIGKMKLLVSLLLMLVVFSLLTSCGNGDSSPSAGSAKSFVGTAIYTDKLIGADMAVRNAAGEIVFNFLMATDTEGLYVISAIDLPETFTIIVTGGKTPDGQPFKGYLKRVVYSFEPHSVYEVNGLTTLVAVFMERNPQVSYDGAVTAVSNYLSLPDAATFAEVSSMISEADAWFSDSKFWNSVTGRDYDAFINAVIQDIQTGKTVSFADETLTADLQPVLDSGKWNFTESSTKAIKNIAVPVGEILNIAFEILDDIEAEENVETLNRIDENVQAIQQQLMLISRQVDSIKSLLTKSAFEVLNAKLRPLELGCISPSLTAYKNLVQAKKTNNANFNEFKNAFVERMQCKSCNGTPVDSFDTVLSIYADEVTRVDDASQAAIQLFTNVINNNSNNHSDKANYQAIEDAFRRFISYQTAALQLYVQYEVYKYGLTLPKDTPDRKSKLNEKKERLIKAFLEGPAEYDSKRMIMQIQRFVPAVETFVVNHNSEQYYRRWLVCDTINSYSQDPSSGKCEEKERPFLRSQIITDQLLGGISAEGYKYGLFVKSIHLKHPGVNYSNKEFVFKMPDGSLETITALEGTTGRELTGKDPYTGEEAVWYMSTYRRENITSAGPVTFDVSHVNNDTVTPLVFRTNLSLKSANNSALSKYYYAQNFWTVPVRDVTMGVNVSDCDNDRCWSIKSLGSLAPSLLRLYKIGPQKEGLQFVENAAIGYNRYIFLPADDWKWVVLCGNNQSIYAYWEKERMMSGLNKIYWKMEAVGGDSYKISSINEQNETKILQLGNGNAYVPNWLYYGWDSCLMSVNRMNVVFKGDWK
ncbi:MAG: hypothetical protein HQK55_03605 [Deltaproteobacteria bacterium]|nr:hypothetical protein [Deltaproteobacteria bacterium]